MSTTNNRPVRLVGVIGTGTDVGKTWATCRILERLRARGVRVAARKPVQSFDAGAIDTDAHRLAAASGESLEHVCPAHRWYPVPMAPPMAADVLGREPIHLRDLETEIAWPADAAIGFVETAGGVRSPVTHDGDSIDLLHRLRVDELLLVADARLGALNSIRLSLATVGDTPTRVLLNYFDADVQVQALNRAWLVERYKVDVITDVDEWR